MPGTMQEDKSEYNNREEKMRENFRWRCGGNGNSKNYICELVKRKLRLQKVDNYDDERQIKSGWVYHNPIKNWFEKTEHF